MTDGTPASIAIYGSKILEQKGLEDIKWVDFALRSFLELAPSNMHFNPTVPGMLSPLLWWTSSDLLAVNPSLYEVGVETMFDIFLQGAVQRTFKTKGIFSQKLTFRNFCSNNC
jgi:hypothetical protein